jgi:SAM-dependent methyltransferase
MAQYQTFPDAVGGSHTLDKLKALHLPELAGKSFLDVGCNEGFFCGFAHHQGARRVLGIDQSAAYVARARKRFPHCEFREQGWEQLPDESFDLILLASALHYADDQPALIDALVNRLSEDGLLIIELGIVASRRAEWRRVERGIDQRMFPSMAMLRKILAGYAWKWMGPSIAQGGDPVPRHVVHISRRRPVAYLLMQPPGFGKSSLASGLFPKAGVPVVSGDRMLSLVAKGKASASAKLKTLLDEDYSPFRIDRIVHRLFEHDLAEDLVDLLLQDDAGGDIALDVYVPAGHQARVEELLEARGYLPVQLGWRRAGPAPMPAADVAKQSEAFYLSLSGSGPAAPAPYQGPPTGHVDEISIEAGMLSIRGWAIDESGTLPSSFTVCIGRRKVDVPRFERQLRPDVQRHLGLPHALVGYRLLFEAHGIRSAADMGNRFRVIAGDRHVLTLSGTPAEIFRGGAA